MSVEQVLQQKKKQSMSILDQLKAVTTIVADTGDFEGKYMRRHNLEFLLIDQLKGAVEGPAKTLSFDVTSEALTIFQ